jgi:hypothetical protein
MKEFKNYSSSKIGVSTFIIMSSAIAVAAIIAVFIITTVINHIANA